MRQMRQPHQFQSAPPVRGAIQLPTRRDAAAKVSIRAPRAGGDLAPAPAPTRVLVSIRAPRAGGDERRAPPTTRRRAFQSAPPVRGAMTQLQLSRPRRLVSIRAPRAGGDVHRRAQRLRRDVSIRAPRAGGDAFSITSLFAEHKGILSANPGLWVGRAELPDARADAMYLSKNNLRRSRIWRRFRVCFGFAESIVRSVGGFDPVAGANPRSDD